MRGVRIMKDFWPKPKVLAWPDGFSSLARILEPVSDEMNRCWWYIGSQGVSIPMDLPRDRKPTAEDYVIARTKHAIAMQSIHEYLTEDGRSGGPGFFSRGAGGLSGDWTFYVAADTDDEPVAYFDRLAKDLPDLLAAPKDPPPEACLIVHGVDWAYWDLYFRDEEMRRQIWDHLQNREHLIISEI